MKNRHSRFIALVMGLLCLSHFSYASGLGFDVRKKSPLTTKGDIYVFDTANTRLPVGANGTVLSADSSTATGLKWVTPGTGTGTVTNSGTLTANAVIIGAGTTVVQAITADTSTTHALFSTAGAPAFRNIASNDIAAGVFGPNFGGTGQSSYVKGDILIGTSTGLGRLAIGADGTILSADSTQTLGVKWITAPTGGGAGTPGSPVNSFQYNSAGSFAGATLISTDGNRIAVGPGTSTTVSVDVAGNFRTVPFALTDGSTIALDASRSNFYTVTLGGNRTLSNPTNFNIGQGFILMVSQDPSGTRKLGFGTAYKFGSDVPSYDASTIAGTKDYIAFRFSTATSCDVVGISKGYR